MALEPDGSSHDASSGALEGAAGDWADERARFVPLRRLDLVLISLFCSALFGYSSISGRPLSLHEARLPQCSREMLANGDWLFPRSGGRPWLERPPLPHWATAGFNAIIGQTCERVWAVRLPAALAGMMTVLLTAWIAGRCFGRWTGIGAGLVLATMYEFYAYASLAEDDIFLSTVVAAAMACFVAAQFPRKGEESAVGSGQSAVKEGSGFRVQGSGGEDEGTRRRGDKETGAAGVQDRGARGVIVSSFTGRPLSMLGFFFFLGLSNFAKGPMVGATVVLAACAAFLVFQGWGAMRPYLWVWGWLLFGAMALSWPAIVLRRYPDMWENWLYDYATTKLFNQPFWYYLPQLALATLPWTAPLVFGFISTARTARREPASAQRFAWCWAIVPVLILSIPQRKHHHYLVPSLAPWAIMAAAGLAPLAQAMFTGIVRTRQLLYFVLELGLAGAAAILIFSKFIPGPLWATIGLALTWLACVTIFGLGLWRKRIGLLVGSMVAGIAIGYCWGQSCIPDQTVQDTQFLGRVEATVPRDATLFINAGLEGEMDFFRHAFYLRPSARILHNLTFLRDDKLPIGAEVYVITRQSDRAKLDQLGTAEPLLVSEKTRREKSPADRFTLFKLRLSPDLARYPAPAADSITTLQGMGRKEGPWCGGK